MAILFTDVAVATPIVGVTNVGEVSTTNFVPVPVCEAIDVAFPALVIGPVKLAFVVAVTVGLATSPKFESAVTTSPNGCTIGVEL